MQPKCSSINVLIRENHFLGAYKCNNKKVFIGITI